MTSEQDMELRRMAERRADAKIGFRRHLMAYAIVNAGLLAINVVTSRDYYWFIWPMMGWGIGIVAHWASVYLDDDGTMRERAIEAEIEKLRKRL
jgi:hypothetical protein